MIVLSAGMQKAGSSWYCNLTNDLLVAAGYQNARDVRQRYHLHSIMRYRDCLIDRPHLIKLAAISIPHFLGNTFAVKTHYGPTGGVRLLISLKIAKATYIYRDPRDVVVSAFEHGQRLRREGKPHTFAKRDSIESAILFAQRWIEIWDAWTHYGRALLVRYEDLVADPVNELKQLANFLGLEVPEEALPKIVAAYQPENWSDSSLSQDLHFHKGAIGRYRQVMSPEQMRLCQELFGDYVRRMGYVL
jgi:hypothetical protein